MEIGLAVGRFDSNSSAGLHRYLSFRISMLAVDTTCSFLPSALLSSVAGGRDKDPLISRKYS